MIKVIFKNSRRNIIYEKDIESEVIECTCIADHLIKFFKIYFDINVEDYPISDLQINDLQTIDIILNDKDIGKLRELKINEILYDPSKKTNKSLACVMNLTKINSNLVLKYIV